MVYILLGNGFEETEAIAPLDCMRRAGIPVCTLGIGGAVITSSHGIPVTADRTLDSLTQEEIATAELVMLPGGLGGVEAILGSEKALSLVQGCNCPDKWIAAICAAPTVLGKLGLLKGKRATVYPGMEDGLLQALPQIGSGVVVDGHIITGQAAGSAWEFGLTLVTCLRDRKTAQQVADAIHFHGIF